MTRTMVAVIALNLGYAGACERNEGGASETTTTTSTAAERERTVGQAPAMGGADTREPNPSAVPSSEQAQAPAPSGTVPNANPTPGQNPAAAPLSGSSDKSAPMAANSATSAEAEGKLKAIKGIELDGDAKLQEVPNGVRVTLEVEDAPPGKHGATIHEKGDCSDIAGESMGEHLAGKSARHGLPGSPARHLGDLGNITVAQDGTGKLDIMVPDANLKPNDRLSLLGKALVIHQSEDKGLGKGGGSGSPIACAVIETD